MNNFQEIYDLYTTKVFKFLLKLTKDYHLAEELTQDTFVKAFIHIEKFQGRSSLLVWLCQIGKNLYFDYLKKYKVNIDIDSLQIHSNTLLEDNLIIKDTLDNILIMIMQMNEPYKTVFFDKMYLDLSYEEISHKHHKSTSWARVTYYRAKCMLQIKIKENEL